MRDLAKTATVALLAPGAAIAEGQAKWGFQTPQTPIAHQIYDLHLVVLAIVVVIALGVFGLRPQTQAQQTGAQAAAGARYTVVDSDATNLIVVDNRSNTLYFYTEDPGKEVGGELHLRGSLDLNQVGKPVLKPKKATK